MRKILVALTVLFLSIQINISAQIFKAGWISYKWITGYTYQVKVVTYLIDSIDSNEYQSKIFFGDGDSAVCSIDSAKRYTCVQTHAFAGPGTYFITASLVNRTSGIQNIPNSMSTAMGLRAILKINSIGVNNSSISLNAPVDSAYLNEIYSFNPEAYDPDGDSLSYQLAKCLNATGYVYPNASNTFSIDSKIGTIIWDTPVAVGLYNFCIQVNEWREGLIIANTLQEIQVKVLSPLAITEFKQDYLSVSVYPNPTTQNITLGLELPQMQDIRIKLYNLLGENLSAEMLKNQFGKNEHQINLSGLANGTYILQVVMDNKVISKKIIKQY